MFVPHALALDVAGVGEHGVLSPETLQRQAQHELQHVQQEVAELKAMLRTLLPK